MSNDPQRLGSVLTSHMLLPHCGSLTSELDMLELLTYTNSCHFYMAGLTYIIQMHLGQRPPSLILHVDVVHMV